MKKTIIALFALAGVSMATTPTITTKSTVKNGQDIGVGFILALNDGFMTYSEGTLGASFDLDSVTLACSASGGSYASSAKMVIFERPGSDAVGTFVALSDAATHVSNGNTTYDFADTVTLDTGKQYQFFFVAADTTASIFSTTENNGSVYANVSVTSRFDRFNVASSANANMFLPTGDGILYNSNYTGWSGQNMAVVTFNGIASSAVPEPTTATLSLLALAGLAARRRRR